MRKRKQAWSDRCTGSVPIFCRRQSTLLSRGHLLIEYTPIPPFEMINCLKEDKEMFAPTNETRGGNNKLSFQDIIDS